MKIIFLDIDGVLNSTEWFKETYFTWKNGGPKQNIYAVDEKPLSLLLDLLENNDIKIVLTSSWRRSTLMKTIAEFHGYKTNVSQLTKYMVGVTKRLPSSMDGDRYITRGMEIKDFIDRCEVSITHYCIIDDDSDMLDEQMEHFVHTNTNIGLTQDHINKIKKILEL